MKLLSMSSRDGGLVVEGLQPGVDAVLQGGVADDLAFDP
jgi:hypothetical protein